MLTWFTSTTFGKLIQTFLISMVPVIELRFGLPYGIALLGMEKYWMVFIAAVVGNMVPVPFIIIFISRIFDLLRRRFARLDGFITRLEKRAEDKSETVEKYGLIGLVILVAIPLPGTGAWTGSLVAAIMKMKLKQAIPAIFVGVVIAGLIMSAVTYGVIHIF